MPKQALINAFHMSIPCLPAQNPLQPPTSLRSLTSARRRLKLTFTSESHWGGTPFAQIQSRKSSVKIEKKDECLKCGMCLFPKGVDSVTLLAYNEVDAKEGDSVIVENKESAKLLGSILVFFVPLVLIGLSIFISFVFIKKEIWSLFLSIIFIVCWYIILSLIDNKLKGIKKFSPEIVKVIEKGENDERDSSRNQ